MLSGLTSLRQGQERYLRLAARGGQGTGHVREVTQTHAWHKGRGQQLGRLLRGFRQEHRLRERVSIALRVQARKAEAVVVSPWRWFCIIRQRL